MGVSIYFNIEMGASYPKKLQIFLLCRSILVQSEALYVTVLVVNLLAKSMVHTIGQKSPVYLITFTSWFQQEQGS